MKKILTAVLCLAVPGLLFLNTWQGWRYNALTDEVAALEKQQKDLLEANRDTIARIAYETSPDRVAEKAAALGLVVWPMIDFEADDATSIPARTDPVIDAMAGTGAALAPGDYSVAMRLRNAAGWNA